jgi:regulator of cell morphogenesis and NO signaling
METKVEDTLSQSRYTFAMNSIRRGARVRAIGVHRQGDKRMTVAQSDSLSATKSVGEWVASDFRLASVFNRYGIDFCCGGSRPVEQACSEKGISVETVLQEAQAVRETPGISEKYDQWPLDFLADYIVNQFHTYTRDMLGQIVKYADAVAHAHGARHPETVAIDELVPRLRDNMIAHLDEEEEQLFPRIKQLVQRQAPPSSAGSVQALVEQMEGEHEDVGATLAELERLSGEYAVPDDGCNAYRALYGFLSEFDATTKKHVHLENNILFPKAIRLEQQQAG